MKKTSKLKFRLQPFMLLILLIITGNCAIAQTPEANKEKLKVSLTEIIKTHKAIIGVAIIDLESGDTLTFNNKHHFPMQSVYKFPQAIAVLKKVDEGQLSLSQKIHVTKQDLLPQTWSPLKQKYPEGERDLTVAELLYYSVSLSDNIACDLLFKLMKGPKKVNQCIHKLGIKDIEIAATEDQMHSAWKYQYQNWSKPSTLSVMLKGLHEKKYLSDSSNRFLMHLMTESSNSFQRIKGLIPKETIVAHKTGTSDTNSLGMRAGCNDIGIITLPNGRHIAITVLVSDSYESFERDEKIIALIAKTTYDFYND